MNAYLIDVKHWIFVTEVTTTAVPTTAPEPGKALFFFMKNVFGAPYYN